MEAQLQRPSHGHHQHEEDPQNAGLHSAIEGEGEGEQHHHGEKKSVLKKVKDKAKKIKDTIKKHGHGHDHEREHEHEGGHRREDNYQEEEEDEDGGKEILNDPGVHGAPTYESTVIRSINLPKETNINLEKPTDRREPENKSTMPTSPHTVDRDKPNVEEQKLSVGLEEDPHSPKNSPTDITPSNYQSKVTDPMGAGGKEAEVDPLVRQFDNLNVHDASLSKPESEQRPNTGSHDQFTPQPTPTKHQFNPGSNPVVKPENPKLNQKSQDPASTEDMSQDTIAGKISSATSAAANMAVSAKNVVASKLGYGGGNQERQDSSKKPVSESATDYAHKVAETLAPVYEKVASTGGAVLTKVRGSGRAEHQGGDMTASKEANNAVSVKEYLSGVHGAPTYESTVIRSINLPRETDINLEKPTDRREPENKSTMPTSPHTVDRDKPNVEEQKLSVGLEEDLHSPKNSPADITPSNYQSKVTDPMGTGGKEAEVDPLVRQFDNLNVHDASLSKPESEQRPNTGSHDQFTPQPTPTKHQFNPGSNPVVKPENPKLNQKSQDPASTEDMSQDTIAGKISSATSAAANMTVSAKNVVASKLGYGGGHQEGQDSSKKPVSESATGYAHKAAETLAPLYEKVASAGGAVFTKVRGSGGAEHQGGDMTASKEANNAVSVKEYLSEKFRPGAEDKALSEEITNALHKKKEAFGKKGKQQQVGKVTESEEVAARLGPAAENKREGEDALVAGQESSGQGVVDRLKDAVGSWLGKSTGIQTAQESVGRSYVSDAGSASSVLGQGEEVNVEQRNRATD